MIRTIVITGCSSGFGKQLAVQLARRGDRVFATMRGTQEKTDLHSETSFRAERRYSPKEKTAAIKQYQNLTLSETKEGML